MRLSIFGIGVLLLGCALAHRVVPDETDARSMYVEFKRKYNKTIANEDDDMRFAVFRKNLERIDQVQKNEQGTARYGVTKFADLTGRLFRSSIDSLTHYAVLQIAEEFVATYTNNHIKKPDLNPALTFEDLPVPPSEKDWRSEGFVSAVPDQLYCGAGWAFATIGNIASQWALKHGRLFFLSVQQLLDCDRLSQKCDGGNPREAISEIIRIGGIMEEGDYPYCARSNECKYVAKRSAFKVRDVITLPQDEAYQTAYLAQNGPLVVTFDGEGLQFYRSGVMNQSWRCDSTNLNLDGLTVGYGKEGDLDYWIVRNSWGTRWGENGYFRITRGEGMCGIDRSVVSAIV